MSIKPIDLQTNISQIHEVSRNEHARLEAMTEQQQLMAKESDEKSRLVNTRLDEAKKGEGSVIREEQKKRGGSGHAGAEGGAGEKKREDDASRRGKDDRMGRIIDVLK